MQLDVISPANTSAGAVLPGSPASGVTAIPATRSGLRPRRVLVAAVAATNIVSVAPADDSSGTETTAGGLTSINLFQGVIVSFGTPVVLDVSGFSHLMHIGQAGSEALVITPIGG